MTVNDSRPPKPKRRWFQFSLRTLLVFVVVVGIGFGWLGSKLQRAGKNREAAAEVQRVAAEIESLGGMVGMEFPKPPPNRLEKLFGDPVGVPHLKRLTDLQSLSLIGTQVTDAGLEHLEGLTNLERLRLANTQVTDEGAIKLQMALPTCVIDH